MSILNDNRNSNVVENNNAINPSRLLAIKLLNFFMINKRVNKGLCHSYLF